MKSKLLAMCVVAIALVGVWVLPAQADPGRGAYPLCYLRANNPSATATYTPDPLFSYNTMGKATANNVTRTGLGVYKVICRGVGGSSGWGKGGHVQVTAVGADPNYCKINSWDAGSGDFMAMVRCFRPTGTPADTEFDLLFIW